MKVFIRTDQLNEQKPQIIATYPDESSVSSSAHGEGVTILTLPTDVLARNVRRPGQQPYVRRSKFNLPTLVNDWRQRAGTIPVEAEAKRRIGDAIASNDELLKILNDIMTFGADVSKWPPDAVQRKIELDEKRNYIDAVRKQMLIHSAAMPYDPSSDKIWPQRILKK
jgi:hypothetical protein